MRRISMVATLMLLGFACSHQPVTRTAPLTTPTVDVFTCASGMVNSLGYIVLDANRDAGFIRTERKESSRSAARKLIHGDTADRIVVTIYEDPTTTTQRRMLRVVGETIDGPTTTEASDEVTADVARIVEACGK